MERVVITGATGMIGMALIRECMKHGTQVCAVVRPDSGRLDRLAGLDGVRTVFCRLEEIASLPEKIEGKWDAFYHLAWGNTGAGRNRSTRLQSQNIGYVLDAVEAAAALGCSRFIGAGSQAEYGLLDLERIGPDATEHPVTPYGVSKLAAGKLAFLLAKEKGIACIWPRIFSVYGIYDKESTMVTGSIRQMLRGEPGSYTPAQQRWDYLFSRDAGRAYYLIGEKGKDQAVYCVGSGKARPLSEYIYMIRDAVDPSLKPGIGERPYPPGAVMNLCADIRTLREDTGFEPVYPFEEGIRETVSWLRRMV